MLDPIHYFTGSLDLKEHPIKNAPERTRFKYYQSLSSIVEQVIENMQQDATCQKNSITGTYDSPTTALEDAPQLEIFQKCVASRLKLYYEHFKIDSEQSFHQDDPEKKESIYPLTCWKREYRIWLLCDAALILLEHSLIDKASEILKEGLGKLTRKQVNMLVAALYDSTENIDNFLFAADLIKQYRKNDQFAKGTVKKLIVTANMSAGKSTLINALIGKPLARTSQEVCTGNLCYMYNKPFEDNLVSLATHEWNLTATPAELYSKFWQGKTSISSYFTEIDSLDTPLCLIDTPGVNAALHSEHSQITHEALLNEQYDKLLYIISPTNLGTDAEIKHLKWVLENTDQEKVIFILNKLDDFRSDSDNIAKSITVLYNELLMLGFQSPIICPISAYFGLLLKMKITNQNLSEDELDEYALLAKKFSKPKYDLSHYYNNSQSNDEDTKEIMLSKKSGLYGLEKTIYGGII